MTRSLTLLSLLAVAAACGTAPAPEPGAEPPRQPYPEVTQREIAAAKRTFEQLRAGFLAWYYEVHPVRATELGVHDYDGRLPDLSALGVQRRMDNLLDWLRRLDEVPGLALEPAERADYQVLESALRAELLEFEEVRTWAHDPRLYTNTIARGVSSLVEHDFAPVADRLASLRARLDAAHALLDAARQNIEAPSRLLTEQAIADTRGLVRYLEAELPAAVGSDDASGPGPFEGARRRLIDALGTHLDWLERDVLPRATADFRLGRYLFQRKLLYGEHVNLSIDELDRLNEREITQYQERITRLAAELDSTRSPRAILDSLALLHPAPEDLFATARGMMEEARDWVVRTGVVTLPAHPLPIVRASPAHARATFASLDAPGPFEDSTLVAHYRITPVDSAWTPNQLRQYLSYFNYGNLLGTTLHETFPGHFVQRLYERRYPTELRKVFPPKSLHDGWALYGEHLALEEGFRASDPGVHLALLRRALQHHARWYAGLHLHTKGARFDDVVQRFMSIAHVDEFPARLDVLRATYDPSYLYAALGRLQILELRKDYEEHLEKQKKELELADFHDQLLGIGLPLPLARDVLIPRPPRPQIGPRYPEDR